jgi:hypothetical protein
MSREILLITNYDKQDNKLSMTINNSSPSYFGIIKILIERQISLICLIFNYYIILVK